MTDRRRGERRVVTAPRVSPVAAQGTLGACAAACLAPRTSNSRDIKREHALARNTIETSAAPDTVFDVLDDAYAYPRWVVGARRIRGVDPNWPAVGARFHHAIGTAAGELHDSSKILERERPHRMVLEVRFRPTGVARVSLEVTDTASGSSIVMEEIPTSGAVSRLPRWITEPALTVRNALSLQRLRHEIERAPANEPKA